MKYTNVCYKYLPWPLFFEGSFLLFFSTSHDFTESWMIVSHSSEHVVGPLIDSIIKPFSTSFFKTVSEVCFDYLQLFQATHYLLAMLVRFLLFVKIGHIYLNSCFWDTIFLRHNSVDVHFKSSSEGRSSFILIKLYFSKFHSARHWSTVTSSSLE